MSTTHSNSEFASGIDKIAQDMKSAEHGGEAQMSALLKDVQEEEAKYKNDPSKLSSFNLALNLKLEFLGLLPSGVEITGLETNKNGELRLAFADGTNVYELGVKDAAFLKPEAGQFPSGAGVEETYINEKGELAATLVGADGKIKTVVYENGGWQIEKSEYADRGFYSDKSGQLVETIVDKNGNVSIAVRSHDGRWHLADPKTGP